MWIFTLGTSDNVLSWENSTNNIILSDKNETSSLASQSVVSNKEITKSGLNVSVVFRCVALYSYDPTEMSFVKGEILDILDNNGKWWQARRADGAIGIVPSNYVSNF
ncbi:hypothetical protein BB561_006014 [Smittium simulii]|uniref:SH3 domain-containing protein n=1 Tax=Smittium simulii TaxID=133385 RepID=A0A2T9Y726_9FUNG|nr:hypothetical protein BB561_006014 [Smittium simulii]